MWPLPRSLWGCYGCTPSRPPASMAYPCPHGGRRPIHVACAVAPRKALRRGPALSLQLMGTAVTRRRLPDPTHPARAPAFVVETGDEYARRVEGGDYFLLGERRGWGVAGGCARGARGWLRRGGQWGRCASGAPDWLRQRGPALALPAGEVSPGPSFFGGRGGESQERTSRGLQLVTRRLAPSVSDIGGFTSNVGCCSCCGSASTVPHYK